MYGMERGKCGHIVCLMDTIHLLFSKTFHNARLILECVLSVITASLILFVFQSENL